jgi:beta-fructofuranosidase
MAFYTSIAAGKSPGNHAEQWAAIGDDDLITWRKSPANPVLTETLHGGKKIYDWRDPFIFHDRKQVFLVAGGNLNEAKGGEAVVNIYEAQNPALTQWKYRGVLFHLPPEARTAECPNFFQIGDRWVLFVSPYGKVEYFVGDFDPETCRFHPRAEGLVDCGPNFYAPNTMQVPDGRRIMWGWVNGFPGGHGWNGCLSGPRLLTLSSDDRLQQAPVPQLGKLRGHVTRSAGGTFSDEGMLFQLPPTNALEIFLELTLGAADHIDLSLQSDKDKEAPITMRFSATEFKMPDTQTAIVPLKKNSPLKVRLFLDRSVLEIFINQTVCATRTIMPLGEAPFLRLRASGGSAKAKRLLAWPMKSIW